MTLLLPEPFGPTIAVTPGENSRVVRLPKLLKPCRVRAVRRTSERSVQVGEAQQRLGRGVDATIIVVYHEVLVGSVHLIGLQSHVEEDDVCAQELLEGAHDGDGASGPNKEGLLAPDVLQCFAGNLQGR